MHQHIKNLLSLTYLAALFLTSCMPNDGEIVELNCSHASITGTITKGTPAINVIVSVSYISNGDGNYESQSIQSSGVIGLTATLNAGNFSSGSGTLLYSISGTPQNSGIASFAIFIGGQSCIFSIQVNDGSPATCGALNVHNINKTYGTVTDQEGNVYKTIVIGNQEWMAENLKTSTYRNGEVIANITNNNQWSSLSTGAWCYFNNDIQYECPYGKLYNAYAVTDPRGVCPTGWHVPSDSEWSVLINHLDPTANGGSTYPNNYPNTAGRKLKSAGLQYWFAPNQEPANESGFSGLPSGFRNIPNGLFYGVGQGAYWWSSTEYSPNGCWYRSILFNNEDVFRSYTNKKAGFPVRCIKD